ncbi:methyltransferase [Pelobium manganitolerans]|uniref:Methyltransferase n=1 Tax=Pelobium manganitolerans TaxID=1842495 RepID=A0A419S321_9SPHI|nr:class I SAM-dependent methyltransferase [Pelobium manganitolerans]RKD13685.1 methyltransferase [Pelobium manganitolerans]
MFQKDLYGNILKDLYRGGSDLQVWLHNHYGEAEDYPMHMFFRDEQAMPEAETIALDLCKGKVLDVGAGSGNHALVLQNRGFEVTAVDVSAGACEVMESRGVKDVRCLDVMDFTGERFDTLLLMMNGIGFCGYIDDLKLFLAKADDLLNVDGQILFDSSDVAYLYEDLDRTAEPYYGETDYQYEYRGQKGEWFSWLYIDEWTMRRVAKECGWDLQVVYQNLDDNYLGRLTRI